MIRSSCGWLRRSSSRPSSSSPSTCNSTGTSVPAEGSRPESSSRPAFILYALVFGLNRTQQILPSGVVRTWPAWAFSFTGESEWSPSCAGGEFLDYNVLAHDPQHGQHYGILLVELGVMITVFGVMVTIFYFFAARGREDL